MNLAEMRARVREDLRDPSSTTSAPYWTDDEVDGAISRAVGQYSLDCPLEEQDDLITTQGSRELDVSSLTGLLKVEKVEFPIGLIPPWYRHFTLWGEKLYMDCEGNGNDARVSWLSTHTLDAASSTIPAEHEELIVLGASGYLAISAAVAAVDKASTGGTWTSKNFRVWGTERLERFKAEIKGISRSNRVQTSQLRTEE
jgi:hypothetical protein